MKTYLLAWNPKRWQWSNIAKMSDDVKSEKDVFEAPPDMPPIPNCTEYAKQLEDEGEYMQDEW